MKISELIPALQRRLRFYLAARTRYDLHSPFIAELTEDVLEDRRVYYAFSHIEVARERWLLDKDPVPAALFGAGSKTGRPTRHTAGSLLSSSAVDAETGRRLFRLALRQKPDTILELGTSQGISTSYLAAANTQTRVITIEGNPVLAQKARSHFDELGLPNIRIFTGSFEEQLPHALEAAGTVDLLFMDGDHREEALLRCVRQCMACRGDGSVFVIADIHWSDEMERAWEQLCELPEVTLSVDLFHTGLLFFRKEFREKQHVSIVPASWKPWRIGIW